MFFNVDYLNFRSFQIFVQILQKMLRYQTSAETVHYFIQNAVRFNS